MKTSFLQTKSWQKFQESLGYSTWRLESPGVQATVVRHSVGWKKNYLYVPYGPTVVVEKMRGLRNEIGQFITTLSQLGREQKSIFITIEPDNDVVAELLHTSGIKLRRSYKGQQPSQSVVIDLTQTESELLSKMHPRTRHNIDLGEQKGLAVEESGDADIFWRLLRRTAHRDVSDPHTRQYYQKLLDIDGLSGHGELEAKLFVAKFQQKPIAALIILIHGDRAFCLYGAADREYRTLMAPYSMHWQAMKYLKSRGCMAYDFWGIDAAKWPGLTRFKLSWGGRQIEYPGAFDLVLRPIWYDIHKLIRKIW